jgi:outer membrane protein OmpA-like peptidoglycan-associated protein
MRSILVLALCLALAESLPAERFKPQLQDRFYLGASGGLLSSSGADLQSLLPPGATAQPGLGASGRLLLGYQWASGWALEAGYDSLSRYIPVELSGYRVGENYVFAEKTFFIEPLYRILYGRRFTLGMGLNVGGSQDKVTQRTVLGNLDSTGTGGELNPEIRAQLLAGGIVGFEFNLGYRLAQAGPFKSNGSTLDNYGSQTAWQAHNSGLNFGFGINAYFGRVSTRPPHAAAKLKIPVETLSAANFPQVKEWNLQIVDSDGKLLKEIKGKGELPKALEWNPAGMNLDPDKELRFRLKTLDMSGASSSTESGLGSTLQPRAFQMAAPLISGEDMGKEGLLLSTQFLHEVPEVKAWKVTLRDPQGRIVKTFEGAQVLPRELQWNLKDAKGMSMDPKEIRFSFEASDEEGPIFGEEGRLALAVKPKELLTQAPRFDSRLNQLVFHPQPALENAQLKAWTLNLKTADGKLLKSLSGTGPLPKEFRFKPTEFQAAGVDLAKEASGAAFIQYSLITVGEDGSQNVAADALALDDAFGGDGSQGLSAGDYQAVPGKEVLVLVKSSLLSNDPVLAAQGSLILAVPAMKKPSSWSLNGLSGKGQAPAQVVLEQAASSYVLSVQDAAGNSASSAQAVALRRSFDAQAKGFLIQRVHAAWFAQGESEIQPAMLSRLGHVADWIRAHPQAQILIQGHSSKEGNPAFNDALAQERSRRIRDWLVDVEKIPAERFQLRSYGTRLLLDEGDGEDAARRNRRIDILMLEEKS